MRISIRRMAQEITIDEGLTRSMTVADVTEVLGVIGHRWRTSSPATAVAEALALIERAGVRSRHRR